MAQRPLNFMTQQSLTFGESPQTLEMLEVIENEIAEEKRNEENRLFTAKEIFEMEFDPADKWLIERMLPQEGIMALTGNPKTYKTWIILHIARCVASGQPVFGKFDTKQGGVLIINEENSKRLLNERFKIMDLNNEIIYIYTFKGLKVDNEKDIEHITGLIKKDGIKLLILDTFIRVHSKDENEASQMRYIFHNLKPILQLGTSVIFTHHHRKEQAGGSSVHSIRGSSEIAAFVSSHFLVEATRGEGVVTLKNILMRDDVVLEPFTVRVLQDRQPKFEYIEGEGLLAAKKDQAEKNVLDFINRQNESVSFEQVKAEIIKQPNTKIGDQKLRNILNSLTSQKLIYQTKAGHNKFIYFTKPVS